MMSQAIINRKLVSFCMFKLSILVDMAFNKKFSVFLNIAGILENKIIDKEMAKDYV